MMTTNVQALGSWAEVIPGLAPATGPLLPYGFQPSGVRGLVCGPVPRDFRLEVAEADPLRALVQVHLDDRYRAPVLRLGRHLAGVVVDRRDHPVARHVLVGAADNVD